jgi:outer membrane protein OmpA-like peptidoglycan-associated protein
MPGKLARKGCPDNDDDSDGVPNDIDECPSFAGPASNNGCPEKSKPVVSNPNVMDSDGDGLEDAIDRCPNAAGPATSLGCPDTDGDGIIDSDDKCPRSKGISAYGGCPDTDGDGLHDGIDSCPSEKGSVANSGCPDIAREDLDILELAMRAVQFDTGKSTLKSESYRVLNQIGDIMSRYPNFKLSIDGHTDNTGNAANNQNLSERRAKACYDYLLKKGVPANQVSFQGFGEIKPISSNETLRGRALNRRVEFNLSPR